MGEGEGAATGRGAGGAAVTKQAAGLVLRAYRTESAVYGVVLVSALIAIGWEDDTDLEVLLFTLGTTAVFWLAHVYAGTIAREEGPESGRPRWRSIVAAARMSAAHSSRMLETVSGSASLPFDRPW